MSKASNRARAIKSNHKHNYKPCLVEIQGFLTPALGDKCSICGKLKLRSIFISEHEQSSGCYRMLNANEVYEKYKDLPIEIKEGI